MGAASVQQMADRVADLMQERLGVKGATLAEKVKRGGRKLPRKVRDEAEYLSLAAAQAVNPKLYLRLDHERIAQAYDICVKHLVGVRRWERRQEAFMRVFGRIALILVTVLALALGVMLWQGLF